MRCSGLLTQRGRRDEGIRRSLGLYQLVFSDGDLRIRVEDQVTEGDRVASRWVAEGHNRRLIRTWAIVIPCPAGISSRHPQPGSRGDCRDERDRAAVVDRVGGDSGDEAAGHVARVAPEAVDADGGGRATGETASEIAAMRVGYTSAVPSPRTTAATAAVAKAPPEAASSASAPACPSMPATISGLRPARSDQWPVQTCVTAQTAGWIPATRPTSEADAPLAAR